MNGESRREPTMNEFHAGNAAAYSSLHRDTGPVAENAPRQESPEIRPTWTARRPAASLHLRPWIVLLPLAFYAAALNPHFLPGIYDNIVYYFGAVSLAEEGSFKFRGNHIVDWPPGLSALLAVPFRLGLESVWVAKAFVVLCAAAGLLAGLRLFQREQRPFPVLTITVFAMLPASFSMGTRIMSEWPYFMASMLFLHALQRLHDRQNSLPGSGGNIDWGATITAGLLLGAASLTKFTGVLLGAAVIAQAIEKWRHSKNGSAWRTILPELTIALIGAVFFLLWKAKFQWQLNSGAAEVSEYYRFGLVPYHVNLFAPLSVPGKISDLFFHSDAVLGSLGWEGWAVGAACAVPGVVILIGMLARFLSGKSSPGDWYALSLLALFSTMGNNQQTRYLMPIAPFLICYGFNGCGLISRWLGLRKPWHAALPCRAAAALWLVLLAGSAVHLLAVGNPTGTHRGLFYPVSRTPETFYSGFWLDLYRAGQSVRDNPAPGSIAVSGGEDKYVTAFTGRRWLDFSDTEEDFSFLLVLEKTGLPQEQAEALNLQSLERYDSMVLYERLESRRDSKPDHLASLPD